MYRYNCCLHQCDDFLFTDHTTTTTTTTTIKTKTPPKNQTTNSTAQQKAYSVHYDSAVNNPGMQNERKLRSAFAPFFTWWEFRSLSIYRRKNGESSRPEASSVAFKRSSLKDMLFEPRSGHCAMARKVRLFKLTGTAWGQLMEHRDISTSFDLQIRIFRLLQEGGKTMFISFSSHGEELAHIILPQWV